MSKQFHNLQSPNFQSSYPLPPGWTWTTLGEIGVLVRGVTYTKNEASKEPKKDMLPVLRANNINKEINFDDLVFVPKNRIDVEQRVRTGDIVIAMSSGSKDLVGKAALARKDFEGGFGAFCAVFRASEELDHFFLGYFFQSQAYRHAISSVSSGVNINNLRRQHIESINVPLPPLPEQRRIVAKIEELFSKLDAGVEALKKVKAELKRYRQAVLKYAFEGKLTEEWRKKQLESVKLVIGKLESAELGNGKLIIAELENDELGKCQFPNFQSPNFQSPNFQFQPASVLLARIREERKKKLGAKYKEPPPLDTSSLPDLPDGWAWATTTELCSSVRDGTHTTPGYVVEGVPLVTSKNLKDGKIDFTTTRNISRDDHESIRIRSGVEVGDVIMAMIGTIGNPVVVTTEIEFSIKNVALFKKNESVLSSEYLKYWLESPSFKTLLEAKYLKGTTQKFIPLEFLRALPIPFTELSEQHVIVSEIDRRFSVADEVEKVVERSLEQAERLRQSILKRAFEGKLVPQDPNDEPASVLLERIKKEKENLTAKGAKNRKVT